VFLNVKGLALAGLSKVPDLMVGPGRLIGVPDYCKQMLERQMSAARSTGMRCCIQLDKVLGSFGPDYNHRQTHMVMSLT
jgi:hypothetical protein